MQYYTILIAFLPFFYTTSVFSVFLLVIKIFVQIALYCDMSLDVVSVLQLELYWYVYELFRN